MCELLSNKFSWFSEMEALYFSIICFLLFLKMIVFLVDPADIIPPTRSIGWDLVIYLVIISVVCYILARKKK